MLHSAHHLTCPLQNVIFIGSISYFSFPDSLGEIRKIRLWHDNGGASAKWFLKQITIVDCQTGRPL